MGKRFPSAGKVRETPVTTAINIDVAATTAHIGRRIREAPVTCESWPHQVVDEFLPPAVFEAAGGDLRGLAAHASR